MIASLSALLAPYDPADLRAAIRERRPLHLRTGNADLFRALLPWSTFNALLRSERLFDARTRMVRRGRDLPREMWSYVGRDQRRVVLPDQLQRFCQEGLSIALNQVHEAVPAVGALVAMLERSFPARVQTNLYASFGRDSAFRAHHDSHDVLVLHLHGAKRWFCYGRRADADAGTPVVPDERLGPAHWEGVLEPGDVLYLPRGEVHRAAVEGETSLHLTQGLMWPRGSDLFTWLAGGAAAGAAFDDDVPVYAGATEMADYDRTLRAALHQLVDSFDTAAFLAAFGRERPLHLPFNLGLSTALEPDCWVQPMTFPDTPLPAEGGATFAFNGGTVTVDAPERAVLAALHSAGTRRVAELPALAGLDLDTVRDTVARLARRSLVLLGEGDGGPASA